MRLSHVEVFHAVMQVGTIKGAAGTLGTSRSRVISVLRHFEVHLGWNLFDSTTGKLQPTPEARRLFSATIPLVDQLKVVRRVAAAFSGRSAATVRVVATPSIATALLPAAISRWNQRFPTLHSAVASQHTNDIVTRLLLGEADFGLSLQNPRHSGLDVRVLATRAMMAAAPRGTWTAAECRTPFPLAGLGGECGMVVGLAATDPLGALLHGALDAHDVQSASVTVADTHQLAAALAGASHGVTLIDPFTAAAAPVQTRPCTPALPVELFLLTPKDQPLSESAAALAEETGSVACALGR